MLLIPDRILLTWDRIYKIEIESTNSGSNLLSGDWIQVSRHRIVLNPDQIYYLKIEFTSSRSNSTN